MDTWLLAIGWVGFACIAAGGLGFVLTSLCERRWRAARVATLLFAPLLALFVAALVFDYAARPWVVLAVLVLEIVVGLVLTLPVGASPKLRVPGPQNRVDERDAIFHRFYRLKPGTPEFEQYYSAHPEKRAFDDEVRSLPGLAAPGSRTYDPLASHFQTATFEVLEGITREIDWPPAPAEDPPIQASPEESTRRVKGFARYLGADLVGTTKLNPAYVYSHIGRSPGEWGAPVDLNHTHAIAIAVEMSYEMIRHAPDAATTTETAFKYFEAAKVAMLVARCINHLGYEARAHVDGNYRVMCGPIAADAGLGELGRLGLIITPSLGPRVRLAVVTTNLPLTQDEPTPFGVQHFCDFCRKCATCCPSDSIDAGDKAVHGGVEKWRSNQDTCYRFWRIRGSDCSICVKVCPYSHPNSPLHNLVRWAIRRSALARRVALLADDLFYGRRPEAPSKLPDWHSRS
jgi:ferredoxin